MLRRIKICLLSFIFISQTTFAMLPGIDIFTPACCTYTTMSFLCCLKCLDEGCSAHGYNKLSGDIAEIKDGISRMNRSITTPQMQKMLSHETLPSLQQLKHTVNQESNTDLSLITPALPRRSLDKKPETPPAMKETE